MFLIMKYLFFGFRGVSINLIGFINYWVTIMSKFQICLIWVETITDRISFYCDLISNNNIKKQPQLNEKYFFCTTLFRKKSEAEAHRILVKTFGDYVDNSVCFCNEI